MKSRQNWTGPSKDNSLTHTTQDSDTVIPCEQYTSIKTLHLYALLHLSLCTHLTISISFILLLNELINEIHGMRLWQTVPQTVALIVD